MSRIKENIEFTNTQGIIEKVNIRILDIFLKKKAIAMRNQILKDIKSTSVDKSHDDYKLADKTSILFFACLNPTDNSQYFSSVDEMDVRLVDSSVDILYNAYILHKQTHDGAIYALNDAQYAEVLNDVVEGGEGYISPFWEAMPEFLQYTCFRFTANQYLNCLRERFSGSIPASNTPSEIILNGVESPSPE